MVRRPASIRRPSFTISNIFFSKTDWPIKAKFNVEPPLVGGTKVCSRHLCHMTKMAATPIYGKTPSTLQNRRAEFHETWYVASGTPIIVCSTDDPGVTLTYFTARSNLVNLGFSIGKSENCGFFRNYCSQ